MELDSRKLVISGAVLIVSLGIGLAAGQMGSDSSERLYSGEFNETLTQADNEATVNFDNRSVEIFLESWNEFRAYYDQGSYTERIQTEATGEQERTEALITVDGSSYRFRFRYLDDPNTTDGDYLRLYRIDQIQ